MLCGNQFEGLQCDIFHILAIRSLKEQFDVKTILGVLGSYMYMDSSRQELSFKIVLKKIKESRKIFKENCHNNLGAYHFRLLNLFLLNISERTVHSNHMDT